NREQAGGFAIDQVEVLIERNQLAQLFHLQQFAFDHLLRQIDERVENAEIAFAHRDFESLHVQPIAGQHALRVAPLRVGRGTAAAGLRLVNDVVVNQSRGVDDLNYCPQPDCAASLVAEKPGSEQEQGRAKALAATRPEVFADLGDGLDAGHRVASELPLNGDQVFAQQLEDLFSVNGCWRAQRMNFLP